MKPKYSKYKCYHLALVMSFKALNDIKALKSLSSTYWELKPWDQD